MPRKKRLYKRKPDENPYIAIVDASEFIQRAIWGVKRCMEDDIPVKGYFYWSFIDNYEWQKAYSPRYGLVAVDRTTQIRTPKPSLRFLGSMLEKEA